MLDGIDPAEQANWQVPNVQMVLKGQSITLHDSLKNKRGIIFGVPGAFTPVCTERHVPGFRDCLPFLKEAVEYVACVAVNDPYVLKAWAKEIGIPKDIVMIADWECKFTRALGLELDASSFHMGIRCRRFCIFVSEGTILWFGLENDAYVDKVAVILHHLGMLSDDSLRRIQQICRMIDEQAALKQSSTGAGSKDLTAAVTEKSSIEMGGEDEEEDSDDRTETSESLTGGNTEDREYWVDSIPKASTQIQAS